ncbi:heterokaryon incompatibility protein-domain-containing protein, partial [Leptodontidium sp. 2 PMI_412]
MRLVHVENLDVVEFIDANVPTYAILSHTWEEEEVTLQDMQGVHPTSKKGHDKVKRCCDFARADGFEYVWIDTCCIDKTNSVELSEAINSMYRWYQEAAVCYGFLADVPSRATFSGSRWFTRGWTLQELIAPSTMIFLDEGWKVMGSKTSLGRDIEDCTGIPAGILSGEDDFETFSIAQRMSWAAKRTTSRIEDRTYSLLGIFGINMPLIYGERENAFIRLQEEIMKASDDQSLFAWKDSDNRGGILATSPSAFADSGNIVRLNNPVGATASSLTVSSRGIQFEVEMIGIGPRMLGLAILQCQEGRQVQGQEAKRIAIYLRDLSLTMDEFERVGSQGFELLDITRFKVSQYPMRRISVRKGGMTRRRKPEDTENLAKQIYPDGVLMSFTEQTALLKAAEGGLEDAVWMVLTRSDVRPDLRDANGRTALSLAVGKGHE